MQYHDNQISWWNQLIGYFSGYPLWLVEGGFALLIGFVVGFIMKLFGRPLCCAIAILVVADYILGYFGFIEFHFDMVQKVIGITEIPTIDVAFSQLWTWMKEHVVLCIGGVIGFAFGWRIG